MKRFKIIDFWISSILIAGFAVVSIPACIKEEGLLNSTLITGYFVVGGWQCISMIIHVAGGWFTKKWGARYFYNWITLVSVVTMPAGSVWILILTAPFMAIYYAHMCYKETFVKMKRPMELLK